MGIIKEFRDFAVKGNMIDMAVGIIIGGAFGKIVSSLVNDLIMPLLGILISKVSFSDLAITLRAATADTPAVTLKYGAFIQTLFDFTIISLSIFLVIKALNKIRKAKAESPVAPPAAPPRQEVLLTEIRDLLARK
jgi:large conductance mechanosensitive channel